MNILRCKNLFCVCWLHIYVGIVSHICLKVFSKLFVIAVQVEFNLNMDYLLTDV